MRGLQNTLLLVPLLCLGQVVSLATLGNSGEIREVKEVELLGGVQVPGISGLSLDLCVWGNQISFESG